MTVLMLVCLTFALSPLVAYFYVRVRINSKPQYWIGFAGQSTQSQQNHRRKLVCVGDSLTHGNASYDFVCALSAHLKEWQVINAGVNGDLAYNVRQRAKDIEEVKPDVILVLVGSNDALADFDSKTADRKIRKKNLPQHPDFEFFSKNYREFLSQIGKATGSKIILSSIPVLGEKLDSPANQLAAKYSSKIRDFAREGGHAYLPFFERLVEQLRLKNPNGKPFSPNTTVAQYSAYAKKFLLSKHWDEISDSAGFYFLTDSIHMNSRAGDILVELVVQMLERITEPETEGSTRSDVL